MASMIYRCPATGANVQTWIAEDFAPDAKEDEYYSLSCLLCQRTHFVNPRTGQVLGETGSRGD